MDDPFWQALRSAHERWAPGSAALFPPQPIKQRSAEAAQAESARLIDVSLDDVLEAPVSPGEKEPGDGHVADGVAVDARCAWLERAAILEFEGGMSRQQAELAASHQLDYWPPRQGV